jgi:hypothetical protein
MSRLTMQPVVLVTPVLLMMAMLVLTMAPAFASMTVNTIDPTATITPNGRHLLVSGPIQCTEGEKVRIEVSVTQSSTGAVGKGVWQSLCTAEVQQWSLKAATQGKNTFEEGSAHASAVGTTRERGKVTDARGWSRTITLV